MLHAKSSRSLPGVRATLVALILCSLSLPSPSSAQSQPGADIATSVREQFRQEERIEAIRQRQEHAVDVRATPGPDAERGRIPDDEAPCFVIERFVIEGEGIESFGWLYRAASGPAADDGPEGRCLGTQGINLILRRLQNALIERGYITSRIGAQPQELSDGTLQLSLQPGQIHRLLDRHGETLDGTGLRASLPVRPGAVLNLRDVEQTLENYKRVPSAETNIRILPAELDAYSEILIEHEQRSRFRGTLALDDSGMKSTGKYQGSLSLARDNPTGLNDLAYLTVTSDLSGARGKRGTEGLIAHYSVPLGYWIASAAFDHSRHRQRIAGLTQTYTYGGRHTNLEVRLGRLLHRDRYSKSSLHAGVFRRASNNYIDDTEVLVQRRRVSGWLVSAEHRRYMGRATVDATLGYRQGTRWFGAISAPEERFGEGTSRFGLFTGTLSLGVPFELGQRGWHYHGHLRAQRERTRLAPPQRFAIGGRYSVRGFDGETVLSAERGFVLRNELSTRIGKRNDLRGYAGLDYGRVGGPTADLLVGRQLAGAVLGIRGAYRQLRYDLFVGTPLLKPSRFNSPRLSAGFELVLSF